MVMEGTAVLEIECRGMASSDEATLEGLSMLAWTTVWGVVCRGVVAGHGHFRVQPICREECWQGQLNQLRGYSRGPVACWCGQQIWRRCIEEWWQG